MVRVLREHRSMIMTIEKRKAFIKGKLSSNAAWAKKALIKLYSFQTVEERIVEHTVEHNGKGFSGMDAELLSSFAKQLLNKKFLSDKQMELVFKIIPRYWRQIMNISDVNKLDQMIGGAA